MPGRKRVLTIHLTLLAGTTLQFGGRALGVLRYGVNVFADDSADAIRDAGEFRGPRLP